MTGEALKTSDVQMATAATAEVTAGVKTGRPAGEAGRWSVRSIPQAIWQFFASMQLAIVTLLLLGIVTFVGTEAQGRGMPLFEVQKHYFESFWFKEHLFGPLHILLPGGASLMGLLTVNLVVGGFVRMRKDWKRAGVLLTHFGVGLLIVASGIKMWVAEEGAIRLFEGEKSAVFESYNYWELAVQEELPGGDGLRQWTVPGEQLGAAEGDSVLTVEQGGWPFELDLTRFSENAEILDGRAFRNGVSAPVVDGLLLRAIPKDPEQNARNQPGLYFTVRPADGEPITNFLWARGHRFTDGEAGVDLLRFPTGYAFEVDGRRFLIALRKQQWELPFDIELEDFTVEFHPNSGRPRLFESVVGVHDNGAVESVPIRMNEPLHKDEFVIYQESYFPPRPFAGGKGHNSQFAVSRNPVDTWPWWSCGVIALGMLWHFGAMLYRYLLKSSDGDRSKMMRRLLGRVSRSAGVGAAVLLAATTMSTVGAQEAASDAPTGEANLPRVEPLPPAVRTWSYSEEFLHEVRRLPIQYGGRVMPLDTFARTFLMRLSNKTSHTLRDGTEGADLFGPLAGSTLTASQWLLDFLFFPEQAEQYRCIEVTDRDVFVLFGIQELERRKRDRHSLAEFLPHFSKIFTTVQEIRELEEKERSRIQQQGSVLWSDLLALYSLRVMFEPLRVPVPLIAQDGPGAETVTASESFDRLLMTLESGPPTGAQIDASTMATLRSLLRDGAGRPTDWFWIPPSETSEEAWYHLPDLVELAGRPGVDRAAEVSVVRSAARAVAAATIDQQSFESATTAFVGTVREATEARGEYDKIGQEVSFNDRDWFYRALILFLIGVHVLALSWARPKSKTIARIAAVVVGAGTLLVVAGVTERCILRERPPISTLYETILFITGTGVIVCLIAEWIQRSKVAITLGAIVGAAGMFAARRHELFNAEDTMPELVAVLDSNFWLAIHVTTINLGYMAMLVAGLLGHAYILAKILGGVRRLRGGADLRYSKYRDIGRMMYGALALGVITSTVGTILGGVWAADSWGRFWGWDPKENGALLIVICGLVILHSRMAGLVRDFGIAILASLSNIVVIYSWFGVNLMGVGLHSYGFQAGLKAVVEGSYLFELTVALGGGALAFGLHWLADDRSRSEQAPADSQKTDRKADEKLVTE